MNRKLYVVRVFAFVTILLFVVNNSGALGNKAALQPRKLLISTEEADGSGEDWGCSKDNILIYQGQITPMSSGIPQYRVDIENVCLTGSCSYSNIHMTCEWFSSAELVEPTIFQRLAYNDCLLNGGNPFNAGTTISFTYANTYKYPLSVSSMTCN